MSTGTSPSAAAEQARLRRERREKKILSQGSSRLEKIAGLQGGATAREALHSDPPEPDISSLSGSNTSVHRSPESSRDNTHVVSPGRNLFGVDGGDEDPFSVLRGGNDPFANMSEEVKNDPMLNLLLNNPLFGQGMGSAAGGVGGGASGDTSSDDLNRLAEKITQQLMGGLTGNQPQQAEQVAVCTRHISMEMEVCKDHKCCVCIDIFMGSIGGLSFLSKCRHLFWNCTFIHSCPG